jgi:hypothetical protein
MKRFLGKLALFVLLNLAAQLALLAVMQKRMRHLENWQTEAVFRTIPRDRHYDLAVMGTSHGKTLSRAGNHRLVEAELGKTFFNLSKGNGTGVLPGRLFLEYFYDRGNRADRLVYFIDAWAMASPKWNEKSFYLADEPVTLDILGRLSRGGISHEVLINYYKTKFSFNGWFNTKPDAESGGRDDVIKNYGPDVVSNYIKTLYMDGFEEKTFERYAQEVARTIELAQTHGTQVIFVLYPTLLGDEPGLPALRRRLALFERRYGTPFYDFSTAIPELKYYYNAHHLNTSGVRLFVRKFLKPALDGKAGAGRAGVVAK